MYRKYKAIIGMLLISTTMLFGCEKYIELSPKNSNYD